MPQVFAFLAGVLFAAGLVVGGMTQPAKVIGFLDVTGAWDPSLAFVMAGAVLVYGVAIRVILKREKPVVGPRFMLPTRQDLNPPLFAGAILFGVGWALAGFCPGPALVATGAGAKEALLFVPAMAAGMAAFRAYDSYREQARASRERDGAALRGA